MNLQLPVNRAEHLVVLDFETYYTPDYTLSKMTTADYVRDPRFETIGVGAKDGTQPAVWYTPEEFQRIAAAHPWDRTAVLAHHAHFDGLIAAHHYGIKPALWFDTLSMARALHGAEVGGSLRALAERYAIGEKGNEVVKALGKHREDFAPAEYAAYGAYCCNDAELAYNLFQTMGPYFPDSELWLIDTTIRMFTEPGFRVDEDLLTKFVAEDQKRKQELLERSQVGKAGLMSNDKFAILLTEAGVDPPRKISPSTGNETWAFAKSDPGMKALLDHEDDTVRWLAEARVGVKSTINETRAGRLLSAGQAGRTVPIYLKYYGAHTGRWSGGDKLNPQNFGRGGVLRTALLAPPEGIAAADSAQIEARVLAWLAGDRRLLELFADPNRDIYAEKGSDFFSKKITKETHPNERQVSKCMVLGMGFGMGWYKFAGEMQKGMMGAPPTTFSREAASALGVDVEAFRHSPDKMLRCEEMPSRLPMDERAVHCAVAEALVRRYRQSSPEIVALWKKCEGLLAAMLMSCQAELGPIRATGHCLVLPNRMRLRYPGLKCEEGDYSYMGGHRGKERIHTYGGSICENIVQALARIVIADQMLHIRALGYEVLTMTHDEIVIRGKAGCSALMAAMRIPPVWAPDLPLHATGGVGENYGAVK